METASRFTPPAGLCESCVNVRVVTSGKGSRFFLCRLSAVDPRFPKYPPIPVFRCLGYVPEGEGGALEADEPSGDVA